MQTAAAAREARGIDWDRFRALFIAFITADFFNARPGERGGSSLAANAIFQGAAAVLVGAIFYQGLPPQAFAVAGLTLCAVLTVLVIGPGAGEILRSSNENLSGLPVNKATIAAARTAHVSIYLLFGTSPPAGAIAVYFGYLTGSPFAAFLIYLCALLQTLFFAAMSGGLEAVLSKIGPLAGLRPLVNMGVSTTLVVAALLMIRPMPDLARVIEGNREYLWLYPPAWFAGVSMGAFGQAPQDLCIACGAGLVAALGFGWLATRTSDPGHATTRQSGFIPFRSTIRRLFVKKSETITFDLVMNTVPRERERGQFLGPMFGFPAAMILTSLRLEDPVERRLLVHVMIFASYVFIPTSAFLLARSKHYKARWIFDVTSLEDREAMRSGVWKAAVVLYGIPSFIVLIAAEAYVSGAGPALRLAPTLFIVMLFVHERATRQIPDPFPFGEPMDHMNAVAGDNAIGVGFLLALFGLVQAWCERDATYAGLFMGGVALAYFLHRRPAKTEIS